MSYAERISNIRELIARTLERYPYLRPRYLWRAKDRDQAAWWHLMGLTINIQLDRRTMVQLMERHFIPRWPTPELARDAKPEEIHTILKPYHKGARREGILKMKCHRIPDLGFHVSELGAVPSTYEELIEIEGVGPHIAQLILAHVDGVSNHFAEDLHTKRILKRWNVASKDLPIEPLEKAHLSCALTYLGREFCTPTAQCAGCFLKDICPEGIRQAGESSGSEEF